MLNVDYFVPRNDEDALCVIARRYDEAIQKWSDMTRNIGILGAMAQEIDEVKALLTEKPS